MPSWFHRLSTGLGPARTLRALSLYPPYLGAGIRVLDVDPGLWWIDVGLQARSWNRNAFGTHFGGSLYAMTDPWFVFLFLHHLGPDFIVWDKSASIEFRRPGRGLVRARFVIDAAIIDSVRQTVLREGRARPVLAADVLDGQGDIVCHVDKMLSIRPAKAQQKPAG